LLGVDWLEGVVRRGDQPAKLGAFLMLVQGLLQLWHTSGEALDRIVQEVQQKIGMALLETQREQLPVRRSAAEEPRLWDSQDRD
jgi:hypothetical protein